MLEFLQTKINRISYRMNKVATLSFLITTTNHDRGNPSRKKRGGTQMALMTAYSF